MRETPPFSSPTDAPAPAEAAFIESGLDASRPAVVLDQRPSSGPRDGPLLVVLLILVAVLGGSIFGIYRILHDDSQPRAGLAITRIATPNAVISDRPSAVPAVPPPPVKPVQYLSVTHDDARAINAAVPFSTAPDPPAKPLTLDLPPADDARAVDCLAAAAWYEAGDDAAGEQAVVQVVLNRLRHPAFPKSVCGVVFEGSERPTGCQFSFTCDGSMGRVPSPAAWHRAQNAAISGMHGLVFAPVGYSTHYHTDWVVPNWSGDVDKVAAVRTQLFYRWRGANGRPAAFTGRHEGAEPTIPALAALSAAHRPGGLLIDEATATPPVGMPPVPAGGPGQPVNPAEQRAANIPIIAIKPGQFPGSLALNALDLCKPMDAKPCTVVGFLGSPGRVTTDALGHLSWPDRQPDFYYFRDKSRNREVSLWNCGALPRPDPSQCMPSHFEPMR